MALEQRARDLEKQPFDLTEKQKNRTEHLLRFAQFQQARADQEAGNYLQAAERFERLVEEAPQIEIAPDALFNAAVSYEKAADPSKAAACYEKIVLYYPASKHYADSLLAPLAYYEKTEQWDRLLLHLEKLYQKDPKSSLAKETLYKLGKRFYKNEDYPKARQIFAQYVQRYPADTSRKLEIAYLEALMSEAEGHTQDAMQGYRRFLTAYSSAKASEPSLTVDPLYLATARFRTLDPLYAEYLSVQLNEPLKKNLARKQSLLDRVVSGYMETVKSGAGEYALASAFRVGEAYQDFWKALLTSEMPRGLSEEEKGVYRDLLKEQGDPYREKALTSYEITLQKAQDQGRVQRMGPQDLQPPRLARPGSLSPDAAGRPGLEGDLAAEAVSRPNDRHVSTSCVFLQAGSLPAIGPRQDPERFAEGNEEGKARPLPDSSFRRSSCTNSSRKNPRCTRCISISASSIRSSARTKRRAWHTRNP